MKRTRHVLPFTPLPILVALALLWRPAIPGAMAATGTITGNAADARVNSDLTVTNATTTFCSVGATNGLRHNVVHLFQIPSAVLNDPSQQFSTATYSMKIGSSGNTVNADLYGLDYTPTPTVLGSDFYEGPLDPNNALIKEDFMTPATPSYAVATASNAALVTYLNNSLLAARADGASTAYVALRVSCDAYVWSGQYLTGMNEAGGAYVPTLAYSTVTSSAWNTVPLGGGGYVTGLASNSNGSAIYARSDVGGAFRWVPAVDGTNGKWVSLTDTMIAFGTSGASAVMGVEGIATDPNDLNRVYVAAGNGIYVSDNQGSTWTLISGAISMDPNGGYRTCGERLTVDPNNSNIVWYGSRYAGLYKGDKTSGSWVWSQIPTSTVPIGTSGGVTFVVCDKNSGTTIVYAGVSGTSGGVYRGTNAGSTWGIVGGATLTAPRRAQIASNGTLYVTGGSTGAAKLLRGGSLTLMSTLPAGQTYHGVAVDPK